MADKEEKSSSIQESELLKSSRFEKITSLLKNKNLMTWLPIILLAIALPVTVIVAMNQQSLRNFAANDIESLLTSVAINPGSVTAKVTDKSIPLSSLAYDIAQNPMFDGITYQWSMSSTNSVATLTKTDGNITELIPLRPGYASLTAFAQAGNKIVEKSMQIIVADENGNLPPTPTSIPTSIITPTSAPTFTPTPIPSPISKTASIIAKADAYVRSDQPRAKSGSSIKLYTNSFPRYVSFLKFNLTPYARKTITKAILRVKVANTTEAPSPSSQSIREASGTWSEDTLNYKNMPSLGATINKFVGSSRASYYDIDVTSWAASHVGNISSFAIENASNNNLIFNSKEATTGKPTLIITYQ